jgi:glutamine synthetase
MLDVINMKENEGKNKCQWDALGKETENMKAELKQKQQEANFEEELTSVKKADEAAELKKKLDEL